MFISDFTLGICSCLRKFFKIVSFSLKVLKHVKSGSLCCVCFRHLSRICFCCTSTLFNWRYVCESQPDAKSPLELVFPDSEHSYHHHPLSCILLLIPCLRYRHRHHRQCLNMYRWLGMYHGVPLPTLAVSGYFVQICPGAVCLRSDFICHRPRSLHPFHDSPHASSTLQLVSVHLLLFVEQNTSLPYALIIRLAFSFSAFVLSSGKFGLS